MLSVVQESNKLGLGLSGILNTTPFLILNSIASIVTVISAVVLWVKGNKIGVGVTLAFFGILVLIFVVTILKMQHRSLIYRFIIYIFTGKHDHYLKSRSLYYEYSDRSHMEHSKDFEVVSKSDTFEMFTDRYVFSGESNCSLHPLYSGQKIIWECKDHGWNFYSIRLDSPVSKGKIKMGMKMNTIHDPNHTAKLFLSTGIYEATERLKMEVKFGEGLTPVNAKLRIYRDYVDRAPIEERNLDFDPDKRTISYEEMYPVYHYKYLIAWTFDDDNK